MPRLTAEQLARLPQVQLKRAYVCANCETISTSPDQCPACASEYNIYLLTDYFNSAPSEARVTPACSTQGSQKILGALSETDPLAS